MFDRCPDCARKHLAAALAYAVSAEADGTAGGNAAIDSTSAMVSSAWVLFGEAGAHPENLPLATGMLVMAEDNEAENGTWDPVGRAIRDVRVSCASHDSAMRRLELTGLVDPVLGHLVEARREGGINLPVLVGRRFVIDNFDRLVKEAETPRPGKGKEGEESDG